MAQLKEANLSDAEFKTLVIQMLKELTEYATNIKAEMKATWGEMKKNLQGTNSERKEARIQSVIWNIRKKKIQAEQNEETRIQRNESLRRLWDIFKRANIWIIGMPEREEEEQETENLFEKNNQRKLP